MKKIRLILHAEGRLKRYGVNRELVDDAINNPAEVIRGKRKGKSER
jgi:hypothetical protein